MRCSRIEQPKPFGPEILRSPAAEKVSFKALFIPSPSGQALPAPSPPTSARWSTPRSILISNPGFGRYTSYHVAVHPGTKSV